MKTTQPNNDQSTRIERETMLTSMTTIQEFLDRESTRFPANFIGQVRQHLLADLTDLLEKERTKSYVRGFRAGAQAGADRWKKNAA